MLPEARRSEGICLLAYAFLFARQLNSGTASTSGIVVRHPESARAMLLTLLSSVKAGIEPLEINLIASQIRRLHASPGQENSRRSKATAPCSS